MHRISNIFFTCTVLFAVLASAVSCINEKTDIEPQQRKMATVLMKLNVNSHDLPAAKSTIDPTEAEKVINSLRIYAFTDGRNVGHYYQGSSANTDILMDISMINVNSTTGKQNIKFYIVANEASMVVEETMPKFDENTTEKELNDYRFIAMNEAEGLPMFCCDTVMLNMRSFRSMSSIWNGEIITGHEGHQVISRTLSFDLKRPLGKISFMAAKMSSSTPDAQIKSVTLLASGTRNYNYLMPQDIDLLKSLSPSPNERPLFHSSTPYTVTAIEASGHEEIATLYSPEIPYGSEEWNIPNSDKSAVLRVEYSMGIGQEIRTSFIYLPPIIRNEWVQVKCTFSGQGQIIVRYTVKDWNLVIGSDADNDGEEDYIIFDYPTHTYILPSVPTAENPSPDPDPDGGPAVMPYMSLIKPFSGYFQILYPEGQTWSPTIIRLENTDADVSDYRINVYEVDRYGQETDISNQNHLYGLNNGPDTYFRIEVMPLESKNTGAKVHLGITADIQGFGHAEYLLINGSQAENFWPDEGGKDPNVLIITQVEEIQ